MKQASSNASMPLGMSRILINGDESLVSESSFLIYPHFHKRGNCEKEIKSIRIYLGGWDSLKFNSIQFPIMDNLHEEQ